LAIAIVHGFSIIALCFTKIVISKVNSPDVGFDPTAGFFFIRPGKLRVDCKLFPLTFVPAFEFMLFSSVF
jgi:hypothetical protein